MIRNVSEVNNNKRELLFNATGSVQKLATHVTLSLVIWAQKTAALSTKEAPPLELILSFMSERNSNIASSDVVAVTTALGVSGV